MARDLRIIIRIQDIPYGPIRLRPSGFGGYFFIGHNLPLRDATDYGEDLSLEEGHLQIWEEEMRNESDDRIGIDAIDHEPSQGASDGEKYDAYDG